MLRVSAWFAATLILTGCNKQLAERQKPEAETQRILQQREEDRSERAALVERVKASLRAQAQKEEALKRVQAQLDAIDKQISDNRLKGKDWNALTKQEEALLKQKWDLQR